MSVNKVILIGRLGADPEIRYTADGQPVATFRLATNEVWVKEGQKQERTEWHRVVAFGRLAEICGEYLAKGRQVYIEGRLQTRSYEDREGIKRFVTEIVAQNMQMLGSRRDLAAPSGGPDLEPSFGEEPPSEEDLPF